MCKTKFYCSPLPKTLFPFLALLRGYPLRTPDWFYGEGVLTMFLCAFAQQTRVGGDSVESSKVCSLPPNENC